MAYGGKKCVFSMRRKEGRELQARIFSGKEFQREGAMKVKDLLPAAELMRGMMRRCLLLDLRFLLDDETVSSSERLVGEPV